MFAVRRAALSGGPVLMLTAALAGCATPSPEQRTSQVDRAACTQRAEEIYRMQNRGDVYRSDTYVTSTRDAPFAGTGVGAMPSAGLGSQFARQRIIGDCLRGQGNVGPTRAAPEPLPTPP